MCYSLWSHLGSPRGRYANSYSTLEDTMKGATYDRLETAWLTETRLVSNLLPKKTTPRIDWSDGKRALGNEGTDTRTSRNKRSSSPKN